MGSTPPTPRRLPSSRRRSTTAAASFARRTGPLSPRYVVAQPGLEIAGERVAAEGRLILYRVDAPLGSRAASTACTPTAGPARTRRTPTTPSGGQVRVDVGRAGWSGPDMPGAVSISVERLDAGHEVSFGALGRAQRLEADVPTEGAGGASASR